MYRVNARKDYLSLAKCKKRTGKKICRAIKVQLQYVRRDLRYVDEFIAQGLELEQKQLDRISQPYIRPIVRGKAMNVDRLTKEAMRFLLSIFQGTYVGLDFEPTF